MVSQDTLSIDAVADLRDRAGQLSQSLHKSVHDRVLHWQLHWQKRSAEKQVIFTRTHCHSLLCEDAIYEDASVEGESARQLFATALQNLEVWPDQLFNAMDQCKLVGRGLLICAVDARSSDDSRVKVRVPITTEPAVACLGKKLRTNPSAVDGTTLFRSHLPRKAGLGFYFVPTDVWKSGLEQQSVCFRVARQTLKATNALSILAWIILPAAKMQRRIGKPDVEEHISVVELCLARPGATLPNKAAARLSKEDKMSIWENLSRDRLSREDCIAFMLRLQGLEPACLRDEPLFCRFMTGLDAHLDAWHQDERGRKGSLMEAWCPRGEAMTRMISMFESHMSEYFEANQSVVQRLRCMTGIERAMKAWESVIALCDEREALVDCYSANFGGRLALPCPACGKPLAESGAYRCGCQQPVTPLPSGTIPQAGTDLLTEPPAAAGKDAPTYRRKKNIQTRFNPAGLQPPRQGSKCTPKPKISDPEQITPAARVKRAGKKVKRIKEDDPTMSYFREQVRCHHSPDWPCESNPTSSSTRPSRRSRRSMPQGDDKLARMLTAEEILLAQGIDDHQTEDADVNPET